jgi:UDPglucose 6-dehydrogenase
MNEAISVIGLGKVGSAILATYASQNIKVYGYDNDQNVIKSLNQSKAIVNEKLVNDNLQTYKDNINLTSSISEAVTQSLFTFVILPTPSDGDNRFTNSFLVEACEEIANNLTNKKEFHTICISSTVMPGTLRKVIVPLMENISGKKEGTDFGIAYSPEFIALGNIVANLINPDLVLIGNTNNRTFEDVSRVKSKILKSNNILNLTYDEAEIVKLSINSFITMKISFANMIGEVADRNGFSNKFNILEAIGSDSRIGKKFIRPGLGYGGPCFPRDNKALTSYASETGVECLLPVATDLINDRQPHNVVKKALKVIKSAAGSILFLGVTYKEDTGSIEESQVIKIGSTLKKLGHKIYFHDFNLENAIELELTEYERVKEINDIDFSKYDLIIFSQKDKRYKQVYDSIHTGNSKIIDLWGLSNAKF